MLDLDIFRNRLFAAATAAAFINGLARFALMFLFVFYFQGAQGDDPDHGRRQADAARPRHAALLAARGHLRRPPRLARAGRARHAGHRRRAGGDDDARRPHPLLAERAVAAARRHRLRHVQQPQHRRDDGHGSRAPARHRGGRPHDAAEHRRGAVDRLRARDRHLGRAEGRCSQIFSGLATGLSAGSSIRSSPTCTSRCGCWPRRRWWARACPAAPGARPARAGGVPRPAALAASEAGR